MYYIISVKSEVLFNPDVSIVLIILPSKIRLSKKDEWSGYDIVTPLIVIFKIGFNPSSDLNLEARLRPSHNTFIWSVLSAQFDISISSKLMDLVKSRHKNSDHGVGVSEVFNDDDVVVHFVTIFDFKKLLYDMFNFFRQLNLLVLLASVLLLLVVVLLLLQILITSLRWSALIPQHWTLTFVPWHSRDAI